MAFDRSKYKTEPVSDNSMVSKKTGLKKIPLTKEGNTETKKRLRVVKKPDIKDEFNRDNISSIFNPINNKTRKTMKIRKRKLQYDELWKDNDIVVIFGPPGAGKSTWAYQVANYIAQGSKNSKSEFFVVHGGPKVVGFFDFEDDLESITDRTQNDSGEDHPDLEQDNFYYMDVNVVELWKKQAKVSTKPIDSLLFMMKKTIEDFKIEVVFVDNMTKIGESIEDARGADPFIKALISFVKELDITLVLLAHTPKIDDNKYIELNHLKGSSSIAGAIDAAIGVKRVNDILYVKQIKHRHTNLVYHFNNVVTFRLETLDNMKWLRFECLDSEKRILSLLEESAKSKLPDEEFMFAIYRFKKIDKVPNEEIMESCGISQQTIYNYCKDIDSDKSKKLRFNKWLKQQL